MAKEIFRGEEPVRLIVLGSGAAYPGINQASSGFLLEKENDFLLIDCGTGVLSNLLKWVNPEDLAGILVTHLHTDHFLDIYPLRYYLQYTAKIDEPLKVIIPIDGPRHIAQIVSEPTHEDFFNIFSFEEINHGKRFILRPFEPEFVPVMHTENSYGILMGEEFFYSGDTGYSEEIIEKIAGVKTILCEATSQGEFGLLGPGHMTAAQAGLMAEQAGAERLILTHIWPSFDKKVSIKEAAETFKGEILLAAENKSFEI